jgi:hypothetical protein
MCEAFSCIVLRNGDVKWKFGMDSHSALLNEFNIQDSRPTDAETMAFAKVEVTPDNNNYINPDHWSLHIDQEIAPAWWTEVDAVKVLTEHKNWKRKLYAILVKKEIVYPFSLTPPKKITKKHIALLKQWESARASARASVWDSVRDSVGASVGALVWDSVRASVGASVRDSVRASVGNAVWDSVGDAVWAYIGSFFKLPCKAGKYTDKINTVGYLFQPLVELWDLGLIPSLAGKTWRLHGGKDAKVLWEGTL